MTDAADAADTASAPAHAAPASTDSVALGSARQQEARRQQMMLRALMRDARPGVLAGWMRESVQSADRFQRGLKAYQSNAGALAERALLAVYPVVQQLLGEDSFAALARVHWHTEPPPRGDLAQWGSGLPAFIAGDPQLADVPYLADLARLEWLLHAAAGAADLPPPPAPVPGLERLAVDDPATLRLRLAPGTALLRSRHPVVTLWQAHQADAALREQRFADARQALADGLGEMAAISRHGLRPVVRLVDEPEAVFVEALLADSPLALALEQALAVAPAFAPAVSGSAAAFDFGSWLLRALEQRGIAAVDPVPPGA